MYLHESTAATDPAMCLQPRQPWPSSVARHLLHGVLGPHAPAADIAGLRASREWLESWPRLLLAVLAADWEVSCSSLPAAILGEERAEAEFGGLATSMYTAELAIKPPGGSGKRPTNRNMSDLFCLEGILAGFLLTRTIP